MYSDEILNQILAKFQTERSSTIGDTVSRLSTAPSTMENKPYSTLTAAQASKGTANNQLQKTGGNSGKINKEGLLAMAGKIGMAGDAIGATDQFAERYNYDPELKQQYMQTESIKDGIASAFGPWGEAARGVEKMGKTLGTAFGGEEGGDIASGIVDPLSGIMETFKNEESTDGERIGSVLLPFMSGVFAAKGRKRARNKAETEANRKETFFEKKKLDQEYEISQGLESIESLRSLRKKQLGL